MSITDQMPPKWERALVYCWREENDEDGIKFVRCLDCRGHFQWRLTKEFRLWQDARREPYKPKPHRYPREDERCLSVTMAGDQCWAYRRPDDPHGFCTQHANMRERAKSGHYTELANTYAAFVEFVDGLGP